MDILDIKLTINEFQVEWKIKYTPNDIAFWAPLLDSDIPVQKLCAFDLFVAWGRESVVKHYEIWSELHENRDKIQKAHQAHADRLHEQNMLDSEYGDPHCDCYYCDYYHEYTGGNTDYDKCQMTWPEYFNKFVKEA